jgi:hypothetical protein
MYCSYQNWRTLLLGTIPDCKKMEVPAYFAVAVMEYFAEDFSERWIGVSDLCFLPHLIGHLVILTCLHATAPFGAT